MDDLIFRISKNHIFGVGSLVGLGIISYLIRRYMNNTTATTNGYYLKPDESSGIPSLLLTQNQNTNTLKTGTGDVIYIFWNGDIKSTYLLIDQLLQDKIVQPLYIERYTILKSLEYDTLEKYTKEYNNSSNGRSDGKCDIKILEYLADVARIKRNQSKEMIQLDNMRKVIIKQYPVCKNNFLPTQYITTISKDLEHTQYFYDLIKHYSPLEYQGIEFYEQSTRYIKNQNYNQKIVFRVLMGYNKNSKLIKIINKIENSVAISRIENPLKSIDNESIHYLATEIVKNDVMRYLLS